MLACEEEALIRTVSPNDAMHQGNDRHYHWVGRSALDCINLALQAAGVGPDGVRRILDLPCGHGRVLRYMRAAFPAAEITACDVDRDGVDFCAQALGAIPVYSDVDPARIPVDRGAYDLIWVGSLFTHLDAPLWGGFLAALRSFLNPGGVLIFTTAGREVHRLMAQGEPCGLPPWRMKTLCYEYERRGFGFAKYEGSDSYYGLARARPDWVLDRIGRAGGLRVVHASERAWANRQDCYVCTLEDGVRAATPPRVSHRSYLKNRLREALYSIRGR